jgi:hypothetical protein
MPPQEPPLRRTYLLRIWEEHTPPAERRMLRFILQEARTGRREGFGSLEALVAYLRVRLDLGEEEASPQPATSTTPGGSDRQELPGS